MIKMSSYAKQLWISDYGLKNIFQHGVINVYSGDAPTDADAATTGTLLGSITQDGATFTAGSRTAGALLLVQSGYGVLTRSGTWKLTVSTSGEAGWFRFLGNYADDGTEDTAKVRIRMDGLIGADSELRLSSNTLVVGTSIPVQFYLQFRNI